MPHRRADQLLLQLATLLPANRFRNLRFLLFQAPLRQFRDLLRRPLLIHQRFQHQLPTHSEIVTELIAQLHIAVFQLLLHPIPFLRHLSDQLLPPPRQFPQVSRCFLRDKAGPNHPVPQQMRQPPGIGRIGLVPFPVLHLHRVGQHHFHLWLQHVEHRYPLRPGALHPHLGYSLRPQPLPQLLEIRIGAIHLANLKSRLLAQRADHDTYLEKSLSHIDPCTSFHHGCYHHHLLLVCAAAASDQYVVLRAQGSISGPPQQPESGSSSGFTQYTPTLSAHTPPSTTFSSSRVGCAAAHAQFIGGTFGGTPLGFVLYQSSIYLSAVMHKSQVEIGHVLWIPPLGWEAGFFFWGWVTDRFTHS